MARTGILKSARTIARMARLVTRPITLEACKERVRRRFLEVVRRAPVLTPGGKLLPFYTQAPGRPQARGAPPIS